MNESCEWVSSVPIYVVQTCLFCAYLTVMTTKWVKTLPCQVRWRTNTWTLIGEFMLLLLLSVGGYIVDTSVTAMIDSLVVGRLCAYRHAMELMNLVSQTMMVVLFLGYKIAFIMLLWERHQSLFCIWKQLASKYTIKR